MAKTNQLKAVSYISVGGSEPIRFDSLSPEQKAACIARMSDNLEKALSDYLSCHPEEASPLIERLLK